VDSSLISSPSCALLLPQGDPDPLFDLLPRSIQEATAMADTSHYAIVITEPCSPFLVTYVNHSWEMLCGYSSAEVMGCSLSCIQGTHTKSTTLEKITANLRKSIDCSARLTNYKKSGEAFENELRIVPLVNKSGQTTHFFGTLEECH
jgi:PAS domain S-box-containing protein